MSYGAELLLVGYGCGFAISIPILILLWWLDRKHNKKG